MPKKIEAFRLSGRVEIDERGAKRALKTVESQAKQTQGVLGKLKTTLTGGSGGSGSSGSFLPGLSYISEIIQGIPQVGRLLGGLISPLTDAAQEGIRFNTMLDNARSGFEGVAGGAEAAADHVKALQKLANDKRVPFAGVLEAAQMMRVYNFSLEEQFTKLPIWMDAIAAGGKFSADAIEGVARAFGQMKAKVTVSAEEMEQLAERGIDGWNLLAKSIGLSVGETRKLAEQGRLNGKISVDLMTEMIALDSRYQGQLERRGKKLSGQLDLLNNITEAAKGGSTEQLTKDLSETLEEGLKIAPLAQIKLQSSINAAISPVSGLLKNTAKFALGGGLTEGFVEGINIGQELVKKAIGDMATNAAIAPFKKLLGIESPSTLFYYFGQMSAQGFANGFNDEFQKFKNSNELFNFVDDLNNGKGKRRVQPRDPNAPQGLSKTQYQNWLNLERLKKQDPDFIPTLKRLSAQSGVNPDWMLNLMAVESGFNKNVINRYGYGGLGQVGRKERGQLGLPTGDAKFKKLLTENSASWQLENVIFPFLELKNKENEKAGGIKSSLSRLYAAWGSGHVEATEDAIHLAAKSAGALFNKRVGTYFKNPLWDVNKDGYVQQFEFGIAAQRKLGAGQSFSINDATSSGGGIPSGLDTFKAFDMTDPVLKTLFEQRQTVFDQQREQAETYSQRVKEINYNFRNSTREELESQLAANKRSYEDYLALVADALSQINGQIKERQSQIQRPLSFGNQGSGVPGGLEMFKAKIPEADTLKEAAITLPLVESNFKSLLKLVPPLAITIAKLPIPINEVRLNLDGLDTSAQGLAESTKEAAKQTLTQVEAYEKLKKAFDDFKAGLIDKNDLDKALKQYQEDNRRRQGLSGGFRFGIGRNEAKPNTRDEAGNPINISSAQGALFGLKAAWKEVQNIGTQARDQFAAGIGSMVENFVLLGETGPAALRKLTAQVLASAAAESATLAIVETAKGFAALFLNPAEAAAHFTAAAIFASVAGVSMGLGRLAAGNLFKNENQNQAPQEQQNSSFTRRAFGGQVFAGRAYIVNDANRTQEEVFAPNTDGYIYPSVDAFSRSSRRGGSYSSSGSSELAQAAKDLREVISTLRAVKAGKVLMKGIKERRGAILRTAVSESGSMQGTAMELNRRLGVA